MKTKFAEYLTLDSSALNNFTEENLKELITIVIKFYNRKLQPEEGDEI